MTTILYAGNPEDWADYAKYVPAALKPMGINATMVQSCPPQQVDYIVFSPTGPVSDFTLYPNLKAVLSLWAGVEKIIENKTLQVPLTRMVDDGLRQGMQEWVTGHVLRHHLGMDTHILNQDGIWRHSPPPLAQQRTIGILGIGELGQACAKSLRFLNFNVMGWSRTIKDIDGIDCYSGVNGLNDILARSDILVLLLPQTPETKHIINADTLAKLPKDAVIINPGRGPLIDDNALIAALDSGHIQHATLDVFNTEPLPPSHPFWAHPQVTVTPHIASDTRSITAAKVIATNIYRCETGQELLYQVNKTAQY